MGAQYNITENTIVECTIPLAEFRKYFKKTIGENYDSKFVNFQNWLNSNAGSTIKKVIENYHKELDLNNENKLNEHTINDIDLLLNEDRFDYIPNKNKKFIGEFTQQMSLINYNFNGNIGDGFCWGHNMIIYSKMKKVVARIYIRKNGERIWGGNEYKWENGIVLRLFFMNIDKHIKYIETAPSHIKSTFINDTGICPYICEQYNEKCNNRKVYSIDGRHIEKCSYVFQYTDPKIEYIQDYINILKEFYEKK